MIRFFPINLEQISISIVVVIREVLLSMESIFSLTHT